MADGGGPRVLMAVEQLRRAVPGGIGAYARGLLSGIAQCAVDGDARSTSPFWPAAFPDRLVPGAAAQDGPLGAIRAAAPALPPTRARC